MSEIQTIRDLEEALDRLVLRSGGKLNASGARPDEGIGSLFFEMSAIIGNRNSEIRQLIEEKTKLTRALIFMFCMLIGALLGVLL